MKKDYGNEILLLSFLVAVTVMLNFTLILMIETNKGGTVQERLIRTFTGDSQLDLFSSASLAKNIHVATTISKSTSKKTPSKHVVPKTTSVNQRTLLYRGEIPLTIDYDKGIIKVQGQEIPIVVEGNIKIENPTTKGADAWVNLNNYTRFDVFVDSTYYAGREAALLDYFNKLHPRFIEMEQQTSWSSEEFYGTKLKIYVTNGGGSCSTGWAVPGEAHLMLTSFFTNPSACINPYYENGVLLYNNTGEFGDHWIYAWGGLHESLHSINPLPIFSRSWLTEGWSEYYAANVLTAFNDINQETVDYYIYNANFTWPSAGRWQDYVTNDYHDTTPQNNEIQLSPGYDITAWMFSMMRDDHFLSWPNFYSTLNNNLETLDKSRDLGQYYADTHIIDLFGRASELTFAQTQAIWRYDGPSGPGWGVRNWQTLNWYADLVSSLSFSDPGVANYINESVTITANVANNGQVNLQGVVVRIYEGANLLKEQIVSVNAGAIVPISTNFYSSTAGSYNIRVVVDENKIKVESNEDNNENTSALTFNFAKCGDLDHSGAIDVLDVVKMVNVAFRGGSQGDPAWVWDLDASGAIDVIDVVKIVNVAFRGANENTELTCSGGTTLVLSQNDANELTEILKGYRIENADLNQYVDGSLS